MTLNEWDRARQSLIVGQEVRGRVAHISDFGVFVDLGYAGVLGLILAPDLPSAGGIPRFPSVGDSVQAKVLGFRDHNRQVALALLASIAPPVPTSEGPLEDQPPQSGPPPEAKPPG